jgi:hypothetical protein
MVFLDAYGAVERAQRDRDEACVGISAVFGGRRIHAMSWVGHDLHLLHAGCVKAGRGAPILRSAAFMLAVAGTRGKPKRCRAFAPAYETAFLRKDVSRPIRIYGVSALAR